MTPTAARATFTCRHCGLEVLKEYDGTGQVWRGMSCPMTHHGEWDHEPQPFPALTPPRQLLRVAPGVSLTGRDLAVLAHVTAAGHLVEVERDAVRIKLGPGGPSILKRAPLLSEAILYAHASWLRAQA